MLKALDMEDKELRRTLQSLACAKHKLLIKTPKGRDVEPHDSFAYNPKFDCKQLRIKVSLIACATCWPLLHVYFSSSDISSRMSSKHTCRPPDTHVLQIPALSSR